MVAAGGFNYSPAALSVVQPLPDFSSLLSLCLPGDTLYLDLDETLISAEPDAAEVAAKALASALHQHGADLSSSWEAACFVWEAFQGACAVKPTEGAATLAVLLELRQRGLHMVGITARAPSVSRETELQLERCGILRFFSPLTLGDISDAEGPTLPPLTHRHGIIYCTGSRKAEGLVAYESFRRGGGGGRRGGGVERVLGGGDGDVGHHGDDAMPAGRVVAVDDKLANLEHIQELLVPSGRSYLGLHYASPDAADAPPYQPPRTMLLLAAALSNPRGRSRLEAAVKTMKAATRTRQGLGVMAVARPDYAAQAVGAAQRVAYACASTAHRQASMLGSQAKEAVDRIPAPAHLRAPIACGVSLLVVAAVAGMVVKARR